jgi:hypothetical protein
MAGRFWGLFWVGAGLTYWLIVSKEKKLSQGMTKTFAESGFGVIFVPARLWFLGASFL